MICLQTAGVGDRRRPYLLAPSFDGYATRCTLKDLTGDQRWSRSLQDAPIATRPGGPARRLVPHLDFWKSRSCSTPAVQPPGLARRLGAARATTSRHPWRGGKHASRAIRTPPLPAQAAAPRSRGGRLGVSVAYRGGRRFFDVADSFAMVKTDIDKRAAYQPPAQTTMTRPPHGSPTQLLNLDLGRQRTYRPHRASAPP